MLVFVSMCVCVCVCVCLSVHAFLTWFLQPQREEALAHSLPFQSDHTVAVYLLHVRRPPLSQHCQELMKSGEMCQGNVVATIV